MDDLLQLLLYIALGLIGLIASVYKNKKRAQQGSSRPNMSQVPRSLPADPRQDFDPELGPLMELFDISRQKTEPSGYETVESGPGVEDAGTTLDSEVSSAELAGMGVETVEITQKEPVSEVETFEEGQSDIQKMIAKYEALQKQFDQEAIGDNIAQGEIVSVEAEAKAKAGMMEADRFFDPRKAIIYAEILKRREY
jgi:hypothetical protein